MCGGKSSFMTEAKRIAHNLKVIAKRRGRSTIGGRKLAKAMGPSLAGGRKIGPNQTSRKETK